MITYIHSWDHVRHKLIIEYRSNYRLVQVSARCHEISDNVHYQGVYQVTRYVSIEWNKGDQISKLYIWVNWAEETGQNMKKKNTNGVVSTTCM